MDKYLPVGVLPHPTSSALAPAETLDPELFDGAALNPGVRLDLLGTAHGFMNASGYLNSERWLRTWMAGSGASYRWHAALDMRDLDMLLGLDYVGFRRANPGFNGVGDVEVGDHLNEALRAGLWPLTAKWRGAYETTWYVIKGRDIATLNPYAAYDLDTNNWVVHPSKEALKVDSQWLLYADLYRQRGERAVDEYARTLTELRNATNPAHRINAEARFKSAVSNASSLFESVHGARNTGFSPVGEGINSFGNYLWQQGKASGWLPALRQIHDYKREADATHAVQTYGVELPSADTLIRRAVLARRAG